MNPTIRSDGDVVTLINVFTAEPGRQHELVDLLREGTERWIADIPEHLSTSLHAGKDGRRVVVYSQWKSAAGIDAMRRKPEMAAYLQRVAAIATFEAIACDEVYVHHH
ncbi:MAG: antibiotic biosynthesis monooxygenase family protein [Rhodospirillales bacterium]